MIVSAKFVVFRILSIRFPKPVFDLAHKRFQCFLSDRTINLKAPLMKQHAAILTAMANHKRLEILKILLSGECAVGKLATDVNMSQSAVSQHLAKLRMAKLVHARRDAQTVFYSSNSSAVSAILAVLDAMKTEGA